MHLTTKTDGSTIKSTLISTRMQNLRSLRCSLTTIANLASTVISFNRPEEL